MLDNVTLEHALPMVWLVFPFVENISSPFLFVTCWGETVTVKLEHLWKDSL
jgi:hypothetical protein